MCVYIYIYENTYLDIVWTGTCSCFSLTRKGLHDVHVLQSQMMARMLGYFLELAGDHPIVFAGIYFLIVFYLRNFYEHIEVVGLTNSIYIYIHAYIYIYITCGIEVGLSLSR